MEQNHFKRSELEAWWKYSVNKPCPLHPKKLIKSGRWGNWCGDKNEIGTYCNGGFPTEEWINKLRKENI